MKRGALLLFCFSLFATSSVGQSGPTLYGSSLQARQAAAEETVARQWNEALLEGIRGDLARPTVHARNLFHFSVACFDAFALYDTVDAPLFLGQGWNGFEDGFDASLLTIPQGENAVREAQEMAMSYASFRLLSHRFAESPGAAATLQRFEELMLELGYDPQMDSEDYTQGPAELGNFLGGKLIQFGWQDGANEANDFANQLYNTANPDLELASSGNDNLVDPDAWQPLSIPVFIDQAGNVLSETPPFQGAEWGWVTPFSLTDSVKQWKSRAGIEWPVYLDRGAPPYFMEGEEIGGIADPYAWGFTMVGLWSAHLDQDNELLWDIGPAGIGNLENTGPQNFVDMPDFYAAIEGGDGSPGHAVNPATGEAYAQNLVKRGDYARVLAEFWADGPESETPPGHWFVLLNGAMDHPDFQTRWAGQGEELDDLRYTVRAYLALGGAMHDAAIAAWSHKGHYDYIRPVSAIRYMAQLGQRSDSTAASYHPGGMPLIPGSVELIEVGDPLAGFANLNVGRIKMKAWQGPDEIISPFWDEAGVDWILAEEWWPYQRPSFVTPPFAGYVSGHSTFSRTAAEMLTMMTGDPFFPGGMGVFPIVQNQFLVFEDGPSDSFDLQWATYRDASDQCSLSRIWGGIHPPADDLPGRQLGVEVAALAWQRVSEQFGVPNDQVAPCPLDLTNDGIVGASDLLQALSLFGEPGEGLPEDVDQDGVVGVGDILTLLSGYGTSCSSLD